MKKVAIVAAGLVLVSGAPALADVDDFTFDSFSARYEVGRADSGVATLQVTESLVARFPEYDQNRGIARYLPAAYRGVDLETDVLVVTDGSTPRDYLLSTDGPFVVVESVVDEGSYVRGVQRYDIFYSQRNVIAEFPDSPYQEFYWDINGTGWPQFFGVVNAEIVIPSDLASALVDGQVACYRGEQGSTSTCSIERQETITGDVVFRVSEESLFAYNTVTVAIAFQPGTFVVATPGVLERGYVWLGIIALLAALSMAATVWWLKRTVLRSDDGRPTIITEYLPPKGISLSSAAHLMGKATALPVATVLSLAVNGVVKVVGGEKKDAWALQRVAPDLTADEEAALRALVGSVPAPGESAPLPSGASSLAADRMNAYVASTKAATVAEGLYKGPIGVKPVLAQIVFGLLGALVLWGAFEGDSGFLWFAPQEIPGLLLAALIVAGAATVVVPLVVLSKKPLSSTGAEARDHLLGLHRYMELAEKERLAFLQSPTGALREPISIDKPGEVLKLYERLLPWAVVLGVDKQWMEALEKFYVEKPPTWLEGSRYTSFSTAFSSISSQTRSSFQSSSSSGSSGGGSAGGGGGGGGGGGR